MYKKDDKNFNTKAIHGGENKKKPANALNNPIFMTSTFTFDSLESAEKTFSFENDDYVYTRGNNPTLKILEQKMAVLEAGKDSVAFASGMAAITTTLMSLLKPGDELITHRVLYGSSYNVVNKILPKYNIKTKMVDLTDLSNLKKSISDKTQVIYFETPANPNLDIIDIKKVRELINDDIKIVVDNTFATPYFQRPLEIGADVVVHSATKYISGHGDVVAGIAVAKDKEYIQRLKFDYMCEFGGVLSPFNGWLLLRGLKTLGLRMKQHEKNALAVAKFLEESDKIENVFYPGLTSFSGYENASQQMSGYGAVISFEVKDGVKQVRKIVSSLRMIKLAVSLGDTETLIEYPFAMTHKDYLAEELEKLGLSKTMLRLSIGLEDIEDIIADLQQLL